MAIPGLTALTACGSDAFAIDAGLPDGALPDASVPDASVPDASVPDTGPDASVLDASVSDSSADASDAGCGSCTGGQFCSGGACVCPPYQTFCNGQCIPTTTDPKNCGGCNVACPPQQACSVGQCSATCVPPLVMCGQYCLDTTTDNQHCGSCANACQGGQVCIDSKCETPVVTLGPAPNKCAGGGPPIVVGGNTCLGNLAQTTFTWALSSCGDASFNGSLLTDAFDSTKGPYKPGGLGGGVGLDGNFSMTSGTAVWGTLWSAATGGLTNGAKMDVKQNLDVGGPLTTTSSLTVGDDAWLAGDVSASGGLGIGGTLYLQTGKTWSGTVTYGKLVKQAVTVAPPVDCKNLPPIKTWAAAAASANDDALVGLDPAALAAPLGKPVRLDLPCGVYYLTSIDNAGDPVAIVAHGHTALFVDGNVRGGPITFTLDPTATFDVLVSGVLTPWSGADINIGSPNYPALCRVYAAGSADTLLTGGNIAGDLYAGSSAVKASSTFTFYGGLFTGAFYNSSETNIHYDLANLNSGSQCPPPPGTCSSCKDCNNQACVNGTCGQCTNSSQCCAPLTCSNGQCIPLPN